MMRPRRLLPLALVPLLALAPAGLSLPPPRPVEPNGDDLKLIQQRTDKLAAALAQLRAQGVAGPTLDDVEVFHRAAVMAVRHGELFNKGSTKRLLAVLDRGLLRASQAARGEAPWRLLDGRTVPRGHRSRLDGTVQPYAVTFPHGYGRDRRKSYRLDVVLHGRADTMNESEFLHRHLGDKEAPRGLSHVQIDVYGRGNNAYRWAGEVDVFETVNHFTATETLLRGEGLVDQSKVVLRGYSMGGAGTWHLGLHRPDNFALLGPGAGFVTTLGYVPRGRLPEKLPDYQLDCLTIYDAYRYAENAANVPIVAYDGGDDAQIAAARTIERELAPLKLSFTHLVAARVKHDFPRAWQERAEVEYAEALAKGRSEYPARVRFVTYTLKYPTCFWVEVMGLERHYRRAHVDAQKYATAEASGFKVTTSNVRQLHLALWPAALREPITVEIDGQKLERVMPYQARDSRLHVYLEKRGKHWAATLPQRLVVDRLRRLQKVHDFQGPIDDAFTAPFLCVRGTGEAWHKGAAEYAQADLKRFEEEWSKYFRGKLPVKDDTAVTPDDMAAYHLVLFGDPGSNSLLAQALPDLPLRWSKKAITFGGKDYDAATHVPVLIYPSPLAANRYVVLNSGHTFHAEDFQGTNALLFPRLGDFAILKRKADKKGPLAVEVVTAGLFDDFWRLPGPR